MRNMDRMTAVLRLFAGEELIRSGVLEIAGVDLTTWDVSKLRRHVVDQCGLPCRDEDIQLFHYSKEAGARGDQLDLEQTLERQNIVTGGCLFADLAPNHPVAPLDSASPPPSGSSDTSETWESSTAKRNRVWFEKAAVTHLNQLLSKAFPAACSCISSADEASFAARRVLGHLQVRSCLPSRFAAEVAAAVRASILDTRTLTGRLTTFLRYEENIRPLAHWGWLSALPGAWLAAVLLQLAGGLPLSFQGEPVSWPPRATAPSTPLEIDFTAVLPQWSDATRARLQRAAPSFFAVPPPSGGTPPGSFTVQLPQLADASRPRWPSVPATSAPVSSSLSPCERAFAGAPVTTSYLLAGITTSGTVAAKVVQLEAAIQLHVCLLKLAGAGPSGCGHAACDITPDDVTSLIFAAVLVTSDLTRETAMVSALIMQLVSSSGALPCLACATWRRLVGSSSLRPLTA